MQLAFDPAKNADNIQRRGLSFELAAEFHFSTAVVVQDTRKDYPEVRWVAVGFLGERLHVLCFAPLPSGIRVISFRKANQREATNYAIHHPAD